MMDKHTQHVSNMLKAMWSDYLSGNMNAFTQHATLHVVIANEMFPQDLNNVSETFIVENGRYEPWNSTLFHWELDGCHGIAKAAMVSAAGGAIPTRTQWLCAIKGPR